MFLWNNFLFGLPLLPLPSTGPEDTFLSAVHHLSRLSSHPLLLDNSGCLSSHFPGDLGPQNPIFFPNSLGSAEPEDLYRTAVLPSGRWGRITLSALRTRSVNHYYYFNSSFHSQVCLFATQYNNVPIQVFSYFVGQL